MTTTMAGLVPGIVGDYSVPHSELSRNEESCPEKAPLGDRYRFWRWLETHGTDLITMAVLGGLMLYIHSLPNVIDRRFAIPTDLALSSIAKPDVPPMITSRTCALMTLTFPFAVLTLMQIKVQSFWNWVNALFGVLYALLGAEFFSVMLKWLVGGFRPNFLERCRPLAPTILNGTGNQTIPVPQTYLSIEDCQSSPGYPAPKADSFPSGHAVAAFASCVYVSLYLNAHIKVFCGRNTRLVFLAITALPVLGAMLLSSTVILDFHHHWWDVLAGAMLGTAWALIGYRIMFTSVFDWTTNHVALEPYEGAHKTLPKRAIKIDARSREYWPNA